MKYFTDPILYLGCIKVINLILIREFEPGGEAYP